ncbi:MAG: triose-phosphate isomerase [Magnetococcus sp. XQGC-1]
MEKVSYLPVWPENPLSLVAFEQLKDKAEEGGRQVVGVHLTPDQAGFLRWELHQLYGKDPGETLPTLYGVEVLSSNAQELRFEWAS